MPQSYRTLARLCGVSSDPEGHCPASQERSLSRGAQEGCRGLVTQQGGPAVLLRTKGFPDVELSRVETRISWVNPDKLGLNGQTDTRTPPQPRPGSPASLQQLPDLSLHRQGGTWAPGPTAHMRKPRHRTTNCPLLT